MTKQEHRIEHYSEYIKTRWDYISKMDLLTDDKGMRNAHSLTIAEAIQAWSRAFKR